MNKRNLQDRLDENLLRRVDRLAAEAKQGKNLSPAFSSMEEALEYLNRSAACDEGTVAL